MKYFIKMILILGIISISSININAETNESDITGYTIETPNNNYSFTFQEFIGSSSISQDDAWYQATLQSYNAGQLSKETWEYEYSNFIDQYAQSNLNIYDLENNARTNENITKVSGKIEWYQNTSNKLPLKNSFVELRIKDLLVSYVIAETYTNENGEFEFIIDNNLEELQGKDTFEMEIRYYPRSKTINVAPDWIFLFNYYHSDKDLTFVKNMHNEVTMEIDYNDNLDLYKAFQLEQWMLLGERFAFDMGFETDKILNVLYPFDDQLPFCYKIFSGVGDTFYDDFDCLIHEYGHFIENCMGNYDANLLDIIINNPNHDWGQDQFVEKPTKFYAMKLVWTESWCDVFSQLAQEKYAVEYLSVADFNNYQYDNYEYEQISPDVPTYNDILNNLCEANEYAVVCLLWDLYDNNPGESFDDIYMSYQEWWDLTMVNDIGDLRELVQHIDLYMPEIRNNIAKIMEEYHISPRELNIENLNSAPNFTWKLGGSLNNPNNQFQIIIFDDELNIVYQSSPIYDTSGHNDIITIQLFTEEEWNDFLKSQSHETNIYVSVAGYNNNSFLSGPFYSQYFEIYINCSYDTYLPLNATHHRVSCECGNNYTQPHAVIGNSKICYFCNARVENGFIGVMNTNNSYITENGSYILSNGIIVLNEKDLEFFKNGTLVFYKENEENEKI